MALFGRNAYDRSRLLEQAQRARRRGRRKRAITLYQRVLAVDPNDPTVLRKIAPLLARSKRFQEAWDSYQRVAAQLKRQGFVDQAIGVYREASASLWRERKLWLALADLEVERGRAPDAVGALLDGARRLRKRRTRADALALLVRAREIQPTAFEPNFELSGLLLRSGYRDKARRILLDLVPRVRGRNLRRLRARLFRLSPSPINAWHWLTAAARG
jgi:tetratricopeptide (TPR) repeat protein